MIRLSRPDARAVERYRTNRLEVPPTYPARGDADGASPERTFEVTTMSADLGADPRIVDEARVAFASWCVHRAAGVEVYPGDVGPATGATVAIVTRQAGLWILAACRVTSVIDEPSACGFTYATLPDHPECGEERFVVGVGADGRVHFDIAATWRSEALLARVGHPIAKAVQRRATGRYLAAMGRCCPSAGQSFPSDREFGAGGSARHR